MIYTPTVGQGWSAEIKCGQNVTIYQPSNVYGCELGDNVMVGAFTTVQRGAMIGSNVKIMDHVFICDGVVISDGVFIGAGVRFCNDREPRAVKRDGSLKGKDDWNKEPILVGCEASIGAGSVILPGVHIGSNAVIGAGAVVTRNIPSWAMARGVPAKVVGDVPYEWGH